MEMATIAPAQKEPLNSIRVHNITAEGKIKLERILLVFVKLRPTINGFYRYRPGKSACIALNQRFKNAQDNEDLAHVISDLLNQRAEKLSQSESYLLFPLILVSNHETLAAAKGNADDIKNKLHPDQRSWYFTSTEAQSQLLSKIRIVG
jgi:hypothetical protein